MTESNFPPEWGEVKDPAMRSAIAAWGGKWQPIETAPKDGTEILACWDAPTPEYKTRGVVRWEIYNAVGDGYWATAPGDWNKRCTHWMPLPTAPTA